MTDENWETRGRPKGCPLCLPCGTAMYFMDVMATRCKCCRDMADTHPCLYSYTRIDSIYNLNSRQCYAIIALQSKSRDGRIGKDLQCCGELAERQRVRGSRLWHIRVGIRYRHTKPISIININITLALFTRRFFLQKEAAGVAAPLCMWQILSCCWWE